MNIKHNLLTKTKHNSHSGFKLSIRLSETVSREKDEYSNISFMRTESPNIKVIVYRDYVRLNTMMLYVPNNDGHVETLPSFFCMTFTQN